MAAELQTDYISGKTCYFLLRNSTGSIWNGASFVAYATVNYTDYDIAATEQGTASGYYVATMPTSTAGVYYVVAKERAGVSPAETDITVGTGIIQWTGTVAQAVTAVTFADALLSRDIDNVEATAAIHSLCSAILKLVSRFEVSAVSGGNALTYQTDGTTVKLTQARTTNASLVATEELGVAT